MLIDLHTHTYPLSWDSSLRADELIERSKAAGLDGIVLSEHDFAWNPEEVRALGERHNFLVLHGIEVNTDDGHILVVGPRRYAYGMHHVHELARLVREADGVMWAAHPYRRHHPWDWANEAQWTAALDRAERTEAYATVAALEIVNGRGSPRENLVSHRLAEHLGLPGTAGTDSHRIEDVGRAATYFDREIRSVADLVQELRAGRCWPVDLTGGALIEVERYHRPPADLEHERRAVAGQRAAYLATRQR
ncbi:MAG: PHP domain-containing protein [Dehalococcoidia bacterium]